jgi:hypothetical protein
VKRLTLESCLLLLYFEWIMKFREFPSLHDVVQKEPVRIPASARLIPKEKLCHAMDCACVLYVKPVLCLQRSSATTLLLRRYGWKAEMVIGAQLMPFKSHAWVEVEGIVVNDKPYIPNLYQVLERC